MDIKSVFRIYRDFDERVVCVMECDVSLGKGEASSQNAMINFKKE